MRTIHRSEISYTDNTRVILEINLELGRDLTEAEGTYVYKMAREFLEELQATTSAMDPKNIEWKRMWRNDIDRLFTAAGLAPIFVEEISNEYCGPKCCPHRVWLIVTTPIGRVKVGWRKWVISLDWSGTIIKRDAHDLFPDENVTKGDRNIHAWSYEKLGEYLGRLREVSTDE